MAQSLSNVLLHIVFSTKNRQPFIDEHVELELYPYMATICKTINLQNNEVLST